MFKLARALMMIVFVTGKVAFASSPTVVSNVESKEASKEKKSAFAGALSSSLGRGFSEEARFYSVLGLNAAYEVFDHWAIGAELEAAHYFLKYTDQNTRGPLGDLTLSAVKNEALLDEKNNLSLDYGVSVTLPTSDASQDASLRAAYGLSASLTKGFRDLQIAFDGGLSAYDYAFSTANRSGTQFNPKWGGMGALKFSVRVTSQMAWVTSTSLNFLRTYQETWERLYSVRTGLSYAFTPSWSLGGSIRVKDTLDSYNNPFDEENTAGFLSVTYKI